jgi:hypothetical protein
VLVLVLVLAGVCRAQGTPLAHMHLDTSVLGPARDAEAQRRVVASVFDWIAPGRLLRDPAAEGILRDVLAEGVAHADPITLTVFSAAEASVAAPLRYRALLSISAGSSLDAYSAILSRRLAGVTPAHMDVDGDRIARYSDPAWPAWRSVAVRSGPGRLEIGLGEGIEAMAATAEPPADTPLSLHRAAIGPPAPRPVLELFIDLNQARTSFPERFGDDAAARLLAAFHLANARSFMLHASAAGTPPCIVVDATWSVRSEPSAHIRRVSLSTPPAHPPDTPGPYLALRPDWAAWTLGVLDAYSATLAPLDQREFDRRRRQWTARRLGTLTRLQGVCSPDVVVSLAPPDAGVALGAAEVVATMSDAARAAEMPRAVRALLDPWERDIAADDRGAAFRVRFPDGYLVRVAGWSMLKGATPASLRVRLELGAEMPGASPR